MRFLRRVLMASLVLVFASHVPAGEFPLEQWEQWHRHSAQRFPGNNWLQYGSPEEAGWSSEKLDHAKRYFDSLDSAAVMVVYDGAVLAAWGEVDRRFPCHSIRKSLLNALYGIHVAEGNVDLHKTLADLDIDDDPPLTPAELKACVVDLLKSRSGVYHPAAYETQKMKQSRPARGSHRPGEAFWYNNWDFNALCTIFERQSGAKVFEEFERRLAVPLNMEDYRVEDGYYHLEAEHSRHAAYPFCMSARDLARIGLLFLRGGQWDGREILTDQWIRESTASHFTEGDTASNPQYGYGYLWWPVVDGPFEDLGMYSARGYGGHAIDVVPAADFVLVHRVNTYWDVWSFLELERHRVKDGDRFRLLEMILDARAAPPSPDPKLIPLGTSEETIETAQLARDTLDRYAKLYDFDSFELRVTRTDDRLLVEHTGKGDFRLLPLSATEFFLEDVELPVTFELDERGEPIEMMIETGPDHKLVGRAREFDVDLASRDVPGMLGGGNVHRNLAKAELQFAALNAVGAGMCRIPVSPGDYGLETGEPKPERLDDLMLLAHKQRIEPILLFEYYTRWHEQLGPFSRWHTIGRAYAGRFRPNSPWLTSQGIRDWGVRYYSAINEPTWASNNPTPIPPDQYAAALEGLADGVHSVDAGLRVNPGGWIEGSLRRPDHAYSKAVAPLFNSGKLSAVGIHRYWDVDHVPMENRYDWSLQSQFEEVKRNAGITADVAFYTDELNFKKREVTEEEAAKGFLTALWDGLGVVGNQGQHVTQFVLPWNIFHLASDDANYGLCTELDPWTPVARGRVLQMVCRLTDGMHFVSCDPKGKGEFVLAGGGKTLWVWQNRNAWTDHPAASFSLDGLPDGAVRLDVYGWDGLRKSIDVRGKDRCVVEGLAVGETYMFVTDVDRLSGEDA